MKTKILTFLFASLLITINISAQENNTSEKFGSALNIGIGAGYYGYVGYSIPVLHANYEFDIEKNLTLAPFVTIYTYEKDYFWDNKNYPSKYYFYRVTVIPIGVKGSYYFDQLLNANSKWDFYASGSAGFAIKNVNWESGFYGDKSIEHGSSRLYLDIHIGSEYHLNNKLGLFLDLSSGISTLGLAVH